jgi:hypothetical protein
MCKEIKDPREIFMVAGHVWLCEMLCTDGTWGPDISEVFRTKSDASNHLKKLIKEHPFIKKSQNRIREYIRKQP